MERPERYFEDYKNSVENNFVGQLLRVFLVVVGTAFVLMTSGYGVKYLVIFQDLPIELSYLMFLASLCFVFSCILLQRYRDVDAKLSLLGGALITAVLVLLIVLVGSGIAYGWVVYQVNVANTLEYIEMAQSYGMDTSEGLNVGGLLAVLGTCIMISMVAYTLAKHWLMEKY